MSHPCTEKEKKILTGYANIINIIIDNKFNSPLQFRNFCFATGPLTNAVVKEFFAWYHLCWFTILLTNGAAISVC